MPGPASSRAPILPNRVRDIRDQSFAFLPHRFLRDGFFRSLSCDELRLYLLLVLAADREGISFYSHRRLCCELELSADAYLVARNGLWRKDLIAIDGARVQVLSLPAAPVQSEQRTMPREEQLTACENLIASLQGRGNP